MTFWLLLALMTAVALAAALVPLWRRPAAVRGGDDVAVYRDQLDEIERDLSTGIIAPAEAEAARVEVSRRLIAAAEAGAAARKPTAARSRRAMAAVVLTVLPLAAIGFYLVTGSPELPGQPLAERVARLRAGEAAQSDETAAMAAMIARVEAHLKTNPDDGRGWAVLAPAYMRLERYDGAVNAYRNIIRLGGESSEVLADLGEALTGAAGGIVTPEAKAKFQRALELDREQASASFYLGLAAKQEGRPEEARKAWQALLARAPADASWAVYVRNALAALDGKPPAGAAATTAEPPALSDDQREMVRGMVDRLAERMKQDGSDVDGWLRLLRAHMVMRDTDKVRAAVVDARTALAGAPEKLAQLERGIRQLGLDVAAAPAPGPRVGSPASAPTLALPTLPGTERPAAPGGEPPPVAAAPAAGSGQVASLDNYDETMRGLTERLAARLKADGSDIDGWVRLVRTYMALGDRDRAGAALGDARKALAGAPEKLQKLDGVAKELGLDG